MPIEDTRHTRVSSRQKGRSKLEAANDRLQGARQRDDRSVRPISSLRGREQNDRLGRRVPSRTFRPNAKGDDRRRHGKQMTNQVQISIGMSAEDAAAIGDLLTDAGEGDHGRLDLATLATLLLEDVALLLDRPGSWEGSNMHTLLSAHGYDV